MKVEIISTGTELLLGEITNTNFKFLATKLNELGFSVLYETTVGDNYDRMQEVLETAYNRADIVITSGGLGPTQGDITKEVTAKVLQKELILNKTIEKKLRDFFQALDVDMPESNLKQALIPEGSIILDNDCGTAPGVYVEQNKKVIINLPGPPKELQAMFKKTLAPLLLEKFGQQGIIYSHTLKCFGMGESTVAETLYDLIKEQSNPTIAIYARQSEILIRLTAKASNKNEAQKLIEDLEIEIKRRIPFIYGTEDDTLESVLGKLLIDNDLTISFAESCTGGLASSIITDVAGSSAYLLGSVVSYSNEAKMQLLNVEKKVLQSVGAVSKEVAEQMAKGVQNLFKTDVGIGITGIAGPDGGSEEKPVGTVYISISFNDNIYTHKCFFTRSRTDIKLRTAKTAIFYTLQLVKNEHIEGDF